jgi:hypothetical protein
MTISTKEVVITTLVIFAMVIGLSWSTCLITNPAITTSTIYNYMGEIG